MNSHMGPTICLGVALIILIIMVDKRFFIYLFFWLSFFVMPMEAKLRLGQLTVQIVLRGQKQN